MTLAETAERLTVCPDLTSDLPATSSGHSSQPAPDLTGTTDRDDQRSTLEFDYTDVTLSKTKPQVTCSAPRSGFYLLPGAEL